MEATILLVDDSQSTNQLNELYIKKSGFSGNVFSTLTGQDGMLFLKNRIDRKEALPELIFLDIQLPDMNGFDFLDNLNKLNHAAIKEIKVVILSASIEPENFIRSKQYKNVIAYHTKSLDLLKLKALSKSFKNSSAFKFNTKNFDLDEYDRLFNLFSEEINQDFKELKLAAQAKDFSTVKSIAHKILGTASSYGYFSIGNNALAVQTAVNEDKKTNLRESIGELEKSIEQLIP